MTTPTATNQIHRSILSGLGSRASHLHILDTHLIRNAPDPESDPESDPLSDLQSLIDQHPSNHWIITLAYNLASTIEPTVPRPDSTFPDIIAQRARPIDPAQQELPAHPYSIDPTQTTLIPMHTYTHMVTRAKEYIAAGDIYQVNLTHPITVPFVGSSQSLAQHLFTQTAPAQGSCICFDTNPHTRHAIISLSPESFLTYSPSDNVLTTTPMKGTSPASTDPALLYHSEKDRAELNMITDLMRNDLTRISIPASVKVTNPRQITTHHNSVHQATATITSTPKPSANLADILRATFPPGSITGAPKVRAMQIIHELESQLHPHQDDRGPYCGSTLALDPDGSFHASVNIRTLHIQGTPSPASPDSFETATLTYRTGAGIVADSDPESEWRETLTKAQILESTLGLKLP
ncbi:MAG: anthranilate synthase component I family protein [Phycisphaerales bacterium]|nr:anthranilate synthase component I family protein [Phycisphaerales bacterium]